MLRIFIRTLVACILLLQQIYTNAQSCVCGNDRPDSHAPAGIMIDHIHEKGNFMLAYRFSSMNMKGNMLGSTSISDEEIYKQYLMSPKDMNMYMHMMMAMYAVNDRFTIMGMFHYMQNQMNMDMYASADHHMPGMGTGEPTTHMNTQTNGLGDSKIYALYQLYKNCDHSWVGSLGVNLPTGNINSIGSGLMDWQPIGSYCMQLGSGTYDIHPGLVYTGKTEQLSWGAMTNASIRFHNNTAGYRLGNEAQISAWMAYKWSQKISSSLRLGGNYMQSIQGKDHRIFEIAEPAAQIGNYGYQQLYSYIGSNIYIPQGILKNQRFSLELGIPIWQYVQGIQLSNKWQLNLSWQLPLTKSK